MKLGGNLPPGHDALLFLISGTGSFICLVAQTRLDIPTRLLFTQSWTTGGKSKRSCTRQIQTADGGGGDLLPNGGGGGGVVCINSPATCRPSPGALYLFNSQGQTKKECEYQMRNTQ